MIMKKGGFEPSLFYLFSSFYFTWCITCSFLAISRSCTTDAPFPHGFVFPDVSIREFLFLTEKSRDSQSYKSQTD